MNRYLFRVQYEDSEGLLTHEPICIRAETEAAAIAEAEEATDRYRLASNTTRTITLTIAIPDA